jgi:hypothetical protein
MKMLIFLILFFAPLFSFAQTGSLFSYEGILTDAGGTPINTSQSVTFQILYGGSCVTFEETQSVTPGASGEFSVIIGAGTRTDVTGNTVDKIFGSSGTLTCKSGGTQTLTGFAVRQLHVKVGSTDLTPDVVIGNVPFSWNAQKLADKSATDFIQVDTAGGITQSNVESIFSRYTALDAIINGNFTGVPVTGITGLTNASLATGAAIDRTKIANGTANHVVINSGTGVLSSEAQLAVSRGGTGVGTVPTNGQILIGNGTGYTPAAITAGTGITVVNSAGGISISTSGVGSVTSIGVGPGLTGGPTITSSGTIGLGTELTGLNALNTTGIVQRTATGTYSTIAGVTAAELGFLAGATSNIQTQINGALKISALPAVSCAVGEALTWQSPSNTLVCFTLTVASGNVSGLTTAIDARITVDTTKLPVAGGTMTGNINMSNNQLTNVGYVHLQNKTTDAGMSAANNGFVWYNSTDKLVKYYDGTSTRSIAGYSGACTDGQVLKWDNTLKNWACAADAGAGGGANATQLQGVAVSATAPTTGQFLQANGGTWTPMTMPACTADQVLTFTAVGVASCNAITGITNTSIAAGAAIARTKIAAGTISHVLINDVTGNMSSEAQLAISRGGTGQSTYTDGQLLIGNSVGGTLAKATLTAGSGITITNGNGSITVAADPTSNILDGSIVNADINASAAIARSKLANGAAANRLVINGVGGVMADANAITADRALISDTNGIPTQSSVTATELGYLSGVTSAVQTQLTGKVAKTGDTLTGSLIMSTQSQIKFGDSTTNYVGFKAPTTVPTSMTYTLPATDGIAGQILRTDGTGNLSWVADGAGAVVDASYAAKGLVQFNTNTATSGIVVTAGVATVNKTSIGEASKILELNASGYSVVSGVSLNNSNSLPVLIKSSSAATSAYQLTLPPAAPISSGQVLTFTPSGTGAWTTPLTTVDSSSIVDGSIVDADISGSAAIARSKIAGTAANAVVINDASGLLSTQAQLGVPLGGTGTSSFTANGLVMSGVTGSSALAAVNCAAVGRVLEWTGTTWGCSADFITSGASASKVNYVLLSGGLSASGVTVAAAGSSATVDLNLNAKGAGSVRVGSNFAVDYETVSKTFRTIASIPSTGTAIDFAAGNLQYTTSSCGAMTLAGMADGATYVLAVKGTTSALCTFTATNGLNIKMPPDHGPTEPGKSTLYTFMIMGTDAYVSWVTGY